MKRVHLGDEGKSFHANNSFEWKDDPFFEAVGTIDELISWLGFMKTKFTEFYDEIERVQRVLYKINGSLFKNEDLNLEDGIKFLDKK